MTRNAEENRTEFEMPSVPTKLERFATIFILLIPIFIIGAFAVDILGGPPNLGGPLNGLLTKNEEQEEQPAAPNVVSTSVETNLYKVVSDKLTISKTPDNNSEPIGELKLGDVIEAIPYIDKENVFYVPGYGGYADSNGLAKVPDSNIVTVIRVDEPAVYFNTPVRSMVRTTGVSPSGMTYMSEPVVYNGDYYKIGEEAYINRDDVMVNFYDRETYNRMVEEASRGYIRRPSLTLNISEPSGYSINDFNAMTAGTELEGLGEAFYAIEQNNGVNGVFALAVAQCESGHGTSYLARAQNNIFGLDPYNGGMSFASKEDCIAYFGRLIQKHYFGNGLYTIEDINDMYDPTSTAWSTKVSQLMYQNAASVQ